MSSAAAVRATRPDLIGGDDTELARTTMRRVSRRLIPLLLVLFICNYIDRTNVAIAKLQMSADLGFSDTAYSFGVSIFFVGYTLFEIPSNLILARVGARRWIARIMITWGLIGSAMMFVRTPLHFYLLRLGLGVAEAGFVPGIVYYLSQWFPTEQRARAMSGFLVAGPVSGAIGSPLSAWLLGFSGWHGLAGWQWVFVLEGIPSVLIGVAVLVLLTDAASKARWLSPAEREWLEARLARDADESTASHGVSALRALVHPVVWLLSILYFLIITSLWTYIYWAPTVIQDTLHTSNAMTGVVTGGIAAVTTVVMLAVGASSDRKAERFFHASASLAVVALAWVSTALLSHPIARIVCFAMVYVALQSVFGPFWCLPSTFLRGTAAAAGIALVNSFGNLAGVVAPVGIGVLKEKTGSMTAGMLVLSVLSVCAAAMCIGLRWHGAFAAIVRREARGADLPAPT